MLRLVLVPCMQVLLLTNERSVVFLQALGESLGKGDDHKDMDIITKFLKVRAFRPGEGDISIG